LKADMNIKEEIKEQLNKRPLLLDGAMGTMLQSYGLKSGECPEEWNISHRQVVKKIHQEYIRAGADVILTNTFGANRVKLSSFNRQNDVMEINKSAVKIAKETIKSVKEPEKKVLLAASVGPTGKILEPYGPLSIKEVYENYKEQVAILKEIGVDLIILETFFDLGEIKTALKAVKENTDLMVIASMTFDKNLKTIYGVDPERAVIVLENEGADGVGANCGTGPEVLYKVLKIMKKVSKTYLMVEPNAGMPELVKGKVVYPASPKIMAEYTEKFLKLGLNLIGGCCGTTPLHIKAMSEKIKN